MEENKKNKLHPLDFVGIGNLLEHLIVKGAITCEERDRIIQRIAKGHGFAEHMLPVLTGYGHNKGEVLERTACTDSSTLQHQKPDGSYISLTGIVQAHSNDSPGYVIQSWLRSSNTLAFLSLWETENNPGFREDGYQELLEKKKAASFTLTPKLWVSQTNAIGFLSKQGKSGGTFAHPMIACEFASCLCLSLKCCYCNCL